MRSYRIATNLLSPELLVQITNKSKELATLYQFNEGNNNPYWEKMEELAELMNTPNVFMLQNAIMGFLEGLIRQRWENQAKPNNLNNFIEWYEKRHQRRSEWLQNSMKPMEENDLVKKETTDSVEPTQPAN